ncbi:carbon storage regulator, CsrA [Desulfacinum infernum DSM 9756]|uniref:Translational regulator CsrA n=1 Tax=Desulfacinum infernum DSM 9756 TaxID=1121391 RepID=A0A1M5CU48_9BACT|nr:carbon storage regulator CsrA [Desulfacinum infernum]SHF58288.1 carbon storage regulator, CsrA [Desulfacinum infernum DSM 9756]
MLILTRKVGEAIRIGDDIQVVITAVDQNKVKVGIKSPRHVPIFREELYQKIQEENRQAAAIGADDLDDLLQALPTQTEKT